jgi:uncharacterized protein
MTVALRKHIQSPGALDFRAVEVRQSLIEGIGVYAARPLSPGDFVVPLTGKLVPASVAESHEYTKMALQLDDDWWLEECGYPDDFINHSCSPNLKFSDAGDSFVALRPIQKGEELFFDYSTSLFDGGWSTPCLCGAKDCRGFITGFEDLEPDVQSRLLVMALPYIRQKHE